MSADGCLGLSSDDHTCHPSLPPEGPADTHRFVPRLRALVAV